MYTFELAKSLVSLGHQVSVLSDLGDGFLKKKAKAYNIKCIAFNEPFAHDFDILHLSHKPVCASVINAVKNVPVVCTIHSEIIPLEEPLINPRIYTYICIRPSIASYIIQKFKIPTTKTTIVYNPVNYHKFNSFGRKKNIPQTALFVGTIDYLRKKVILKLIEDSKDRNINVIIVGEKKQDYLPNPLPKNVKYYKPCFDIEKYYKQATETHGIMLGRTTIEGWACGLPAYIYEVDGEGEIKNIEYKTADKLDLIKFNSKIVAEQIDYIYFDVIEKYKQKIKSNESADLHKKYDAIYCINLDKRPQRWDDAQQEFVKFNIIDVERISGVDGSLLEESKVISQDGLVVSKGDIGCSLSHLSVVKTAKKLNLNNYIVFEDDVEFHPEFNSLFNEYIKQVPNDWDAIYFGGSHQVSPIMVTENVAKLVKTYTTHAMIIKNTLYDSLIELWNKAEKVDISISQLQNEFNFYGFIPSLISQRDGFSDILQRDVSYAFLK